MQLNSRGKGPDVSSEFSTFCHQHTQEAHTQIIQVVVLLVKHFLKTPYILNAP